MLRAAREREQCAWADGLPPPREHRPQLCFDHEERVDPVVLIVKRQIRMRSTEMRFDEAQVG